jgi:predicted RNA methylase
VTLRLDIDLTDEQKAAMAAIPATVWFTRVVYRNAASPLHPNFQLHQNNEMKQALLNDWVRKSVKGKRVLDLFCGNGAFSFIAALAGAKEVVGVDYAEERIKCARFVSGTIPLNCKINFRCGDVYKIAENFDSCQ